MIICGYLWNALYCTLYTVQCSIHMYSIPFTCCVYHRFSWRQTVIYRAELDDIYNVASLRKKFLVFCTFLCLPFYVYLCFMSKKSCPYKKASNCSIMDKTSWTYSMYYQLSHYVRVLLPFLVRFWHIILAYSLYYWNILSFSEKATKFSKMGDGGFDPCECIFNHEMAMRRLLSLLR